MKYIKQISISIIIFLFYYFFSNIFDFILDVFKININNLSRNMVIFIVYIIEIIPLILLLLIYRKDLIKEFLVFKDTFKEKIEKYIKIWIFSIVLMTIFNIIIELFTGQELSNNESAIRDISTSLPIYIIFTSSIIAPLCEEIIYRKVINNIFIKKNLSIIMSGLIFGLAHVIGTYKELTDLLYIVSYGIIGSCFMYIYLDSKSIWYTIFIHFMHNSLLLIALFIR